MIKSAKHLKAISLRDKYRNEMVKILDLQFELKPAKRTFPVYWENWANRLLKIEYLIIDFKYQK